MTSALTHVSPAHWCCPPSRLISRLHTFLLHDMILVDNLTLLWNRRRFWDWQFYDIFPARTAVTFVIKCWLAANVTVAQGPIGWSHSEVDRPCASFRSRTEGSYRRRLDQYAHLETFWAFIYEIEQGSELLHAFKIVIKMHEHFGTVRDVATLNLEYS